MRILIGALICIQLLLPLTVYSADSCYSFYANKTNQLKALVEQTSLTGGFKWEPADLTNPTELNKIYELYKNTYSVFGMVLESADKLAQSRLAAVIKDKNGEIIAFMLGRLDQFGFFATQVGGGTSRQSLLVLGQTFKTPLPKGIYFQASGHVLLTSIKAGINKVIPYEKVAQIRRVQGRPIRRPTKTELIEAIEKKYLPDDPETLKNAYYTTVFMNNEVKEVIKVMVGNPL